MNNTLLPEDSSIAENVPKIPRMTKLEYLRCFKKQKSTNNDKSIGFNMASDSRDAIKMKIKVKSSHPIHSSYAGSTNKAREEDENSNMARAKVLKILRIVRMIYDNFAMEGKSGETSQSTKRKRPDLRAAQVIEDKFGKCPPTIGPIPGVEIGDKFNFRVELALVGLHMPLRSGIGTIIIKNPNECRICTSIVATGSYYKNDMKDPDYLTYSGQGGIISKSRTKVEDQKLERGNLALMNSITQKNQVRVIRQRNEKEKSVFMYDGLYVVENCREVRGSSDNLIFMFGLRRIPGQLQLPKH